MKHTKLLITIVFAIALAFPLVNVFAETSSPPDVAAFIEARKKLKEEQARKAAEDKVNATASATTTTPAAVITEDTDKPLTTVQIRAKKAVLVGKKAKLNAKKCAVVNSRVNIQITKFQNNLNRRSAWHNRFSRHIKNFITKYKADGYDTTKLETDLVQLNLLIDTFATDKTAYITLLKQSRIYACARSEGEIKSKLIDAKEALKKAKASELAVRTYYQSIIRPDILSLKTQRKTAD